MPGVVGKNTATGGRKEEGGGKREEGGEKQERSIRDAHIEFSTGRFDLHQDIS